MLNIKYQVKSFELILSFGFHFSFFFGINLYSVVVVDAIVVVVGTNLYSIVVVGAIVVVVSTNLYSVVVVGAIVVVVVGTGSSPTFQDRLPFLSS